MKLIIEKIEGEFNLNHLKDGLSKLKDGLYVIDIKRVKNKRTLNQNSWLWGCIYPLLLESLISEGWEFTDIEQVHEFFKAQMTSDKVINKHTGEIIQFPESTAKMDTLTFSTYCEKLRDYAKEFLNIDIPDPDKEFWSNKLL